MISVIVVSYNTRDMTLACLASVYKHSVGEDVDLIVIDNDSSDGSADAIAANFPELTLIRSRENLGFAQANNLAARQARGDYLLLLNPDTLVLEGSINRLYSFAKAHPLHRIYGGRTLFADHSLNPSSCWGRATPWSFFCYGTGLTSLFRKSKLFNPEAYGAWQRDSVREVDIVSGCFFLVEKKLWDELGGFDPKFFMYGEEADLCLRAKKLGARPVICPDATIIHYGGASEKVRSDKMVRLFSAKIELIKRHWSPAWVPFGVLMYKWAALSRWQVCAVLALFRPKFKESALSWRQIWQRRREWSAGYP